MCGSAQLWHVVPALLLLSAAACLAEVTSLEMPMRDGVRLRTTVFKPGPGSYPVVLTRGYSAWNADNRHAAPFNGSEPVAARPNVIPAGDTP